MELENRFEIPVSADRVWAYLLDIERVVVCMPGAELTETIDDSNFKGKVTVKVGPVTLSFQGRVTMTERDDQVHRVVLKARGMEQRGKGAAEATITSTLEESDGTTRVTVIQDLKVTGQAAQLSRGMMEDVTAKLTRQFADCIKANLELAESAEPGETPEQVRAEPVKGLRLALSAFGGAVTRFFRRLFGRESA